MDGGDVEIPSWNTVRESRSLMPATRDELAEISRNNGKRSRGPRTAEGKARARQNALKHGLRAEVLALPNEDPAAIAARSNEWNDYYRPRSPLGQQSLNACVRATLLNDRCDRFQDEALTRQILQ